MLLLFVLSLARPATAEVRSRGEALLLHHRSGAELEVQLRARLGVAPSPGGPNAKISDAPLAVPPIKFYPLTTWKTEGDELVTEVAAATGMKLQVHVKEEPDGRFSVRMDATALADSWISLLSLEAELAATEAQVAGRDLRPYKVDRMVALSGLDPKWVIFKPGPVTAAAAAPGPDKNSGAEAWTLVLDDQADGLKVHREKTQLILQADLLSTDARPFSHFINCTDNWRSPNHRVVLPTRQLQEGEALQTTLSLYAGGAVPLFKARYPDGRSAALVITDHADQTAAPTLRALAGGTSDTHDASWGKGGLLGNGLLITKALWLSSGEPAPAPLFSARPAAAPAPLLTPAPSGPGPHLKPARPSKTLQTFRLRYERPQVDPTGGGRPQLDDPEVAELAERLARAGWELSPHSATPLRDERERTEEALQFFDHWKSRTWIDHQPYTNCEALINRGYQGGEFGIVDLLAQHGYGYAWSGLDVPASTTLNLLSPKHLDHYMPVLWPAGRLWPGMPGSLWLFSSMMTYMDSAKFFGLYKKKALDQLEKERGLHIAHTYLEAFHPPGSMFAKRNLMVPGRHSGEIVVHPKLAELFAQLATRVQRGSLWVPTLQQLGDHMRGMQDVTVRLGNDGTATLRAERPILGATFVVPAAQLRVLIDGQPAKGISYTKNETTFWTDLPDLRPVRVEFLDAQGKPVAILRPPARKSLLANLPPPRPQSRLRPAASLSAGLVSPRPSRPQPYRRPATPLLAGLPPPGPARPHPRLLPPRPRNKL